ncbi:hypothetical protein SK128_021108, partial [Halocaridina rubra]
EVREEKLMDKLELYVVQSIPVLQRCAKRIYKLCEDAIKISRNTKAEQVQNKRNIKPNYVTKDKQILAHQDLILHC